MAAGDFNGDGKIDLAVTNECGDSNCDGSVTILLGNGDGTFQTAQTYILGGTDLSVVTVGDFNGDGKVDLAVANHLMNVTKKLSPGNTLHVVMPWMLSQKRPEGL